MDDGVVGDRSRGLTYVSGEWAPTDRATPRRGHAWHPARGRAAGAQAFPDACVEVGQILGRGHGDVLFPGERAPDLRHQLLQHRGMLHETVGESRQRGCGGFAAGDDGDVQRRLDFEHRHGLQVFVARDQWRHEVVSLRLEVHPTINLVRDVLEMLFLFFQQALGQQSHEDRLEDGIMSHHGGEGHGFDVIEHHGNPRMIPTFLETAERLAETEIAHDIEGGEVEPVHHVDHAPLRTSRRGAFPESGHQQRHIGLNDGLLRSQGLLGESVFHQLSHPIVILEDARHWHSRIGLAVG